MHHDDETNHEEHRAVDSMIAEEREAELSIGAYEGAEFLADPCIMKGCIHSYGHIGGHEYAGAPTQTTTPAAESK